MKLIVASILGAVALVASAFYTGKGTTSNSTVTAPSQATVETVILPASNLPVASVTNALVSANKTVLKPVVNASRVLYLNNVVTFYSSQKLANEIKELNAKSSEPIYIMIDSPGGSVFDGATPIAEMEASKAPIYTVCTRLCASMAAMIHSYGHKRYMLDKALLMYHPASGGLMGQVPNMLSQLNTITRYLDKMNANVIGRSKISRDEFEKLVSYELWVDSEDAVTRGLSDGILNLNIPAHPVQKGAVDLPDPDQEEAGDSVTFEPTAPRKTDIQLIAPDLTPWKHNVRKD